MSDSSYPTVKIGRNPLWARGLFWMEYKDADGNSFGSTGMTFEEITKALKLHFSPTTKIEEEA